MVMMVAAALFVSAGGWTLLRHRSSDEVVFSVGLFLVACACLIRVDALELAAQDVLPGGTSELIKHVLIATGCICIASYGSAVVLNRPIRPLLVTCVSIGAAVVMAAVFVAQGPWTNADLSEQLAGKPWMIAYWAAYYGAFCWSVIALGTAALRGNSAESRRHAAWLILLAIASGVALVWALLSIAKNVFLLSGIDTTVLDAIRIPAAAAFSVLLMTGFLGYAAHRWVDYRREQQHLAVLHKRLIALVPEVQLTTPSAGIADYHRSIEIADALSVLSSFTDLSDSDLIKTVLGTTSTATARAYSVEIAAERRACNKASVSPCDFEWASDDDALVDVGRAISRPSFPRNRLKVTSVALG